MSISLPINTNTFMGGCLNKPSYVDGSYEITQHMFWAVKLEKTYIIIHSYLEACNS